jgi:rSAM/selenodomain-associated transferase 2
MSATLSVIIPTLDEAGTLPALLADLHAQTGLVLQIIVADGGSRDGTPGLALAAGAQLQTSPRGRARQMNAGRRLATAAHLLFLHADSRLPDPQLLARALASLQACADPRVAGHFGLRFIRHQPGRERFYRFLEAKTRSQRPGTINGDQGLLLRASWFDQLGGFDESLPYLEDQHFAATVFRYGRWLLLPGELHTSARRFEQEGHGRRYALMGLMSAMHTLGLRAFFDAAPGIYVAQSETHELRLGPYLRLAARLIVTRPRCWWPLLRLGLANAWQLGLALRIRLGRHPGR